MLSGTGAKKQKTDRRPARAVQEAVRAAQDAAVSYMKKKKNNE